jgi:hypothetical protein
MRKTIFQILSPSTIKLLKKKKKKKKNRERGELIERDGEKEKKRGKNIKEKELK